MSNSITFSRKELDYLAYLLYNGGTAADPIFPLIFDDVVDIDIFRTKLGELLNVGERLPSNLLSQKDVIQERREEVDRYLQIRRDSDWS